MARRLIALVLLAALVLTGAAGCKAKGAQESGTGPATNVSVPTATADATSSAATTQSSAPGTSEAASAEAASIEKELSAIQKELDSMSLPGDSDFDSIQSELP